MKRVLLPAVNSKKWLCLDDLEGEIWKDVHAYEGLYMVSNYGRIKSLDRTPHNIRKRLFLGVILKQRLIQKYYSVCLSKTNSTKTFRVHRLVCMAFHKNPYNLQFINHINEIKTDNRSDNLEWCTRLYNTNYGTGKKRSGIANRNNKHSSYPVLQFDKNGVFINEYPSLGEAYRQTGIHYQNIRACFIEKKGKQNTAGGYIWKLKKDRVKDLKKENIPSANHIRVNKYSIEGEYIETFETIKEAANNVGVCATSIRNCMNGIIHTSGGYVWKRANK